MKKMNKLWIPVTFAIIAAIFVTCDSKTTNLTPKSITIYSAKRYTEFGVDKACYWADSMRYDLPVPAGSKYSFASGIIVVDGQVRTAGFYEESGLQRACHWAGTNRIDLPYFVEIEDDYPHNILIVAE